MAIADIFTYAIVFAIVSLHALRFELHYATIFAAITPPLRHYATPLRHDTPDIDAMNIAIIATLRCHYYAFHIILPPCHIHIHY